MTAKENLMAIDRDLKLLTGKGMSQVSEEENKDKPFPLRSLLISFLDEAGPHMSLAPYLT